MDETSIKCIDGTLYGLSPPSMLISLSIQIQQLNLSPNTQKILHEQEFFVANRFEQKFEEQLALQLPK